MTSRRHLRRPLTWISVAFIGLLLVPAVSIALRRHATPAPQWPGVSLASGKTSQHGVVTVYLVRHHVVAQLIIELRTRCTDHKRRDIWPGFVVPFDHPQDAHGRMTDAYALVGRNAATGERFRQRASFSARLTHNTLTGSASVTQTLIATGVVCRSPRVSFSVHL